MYICEFSGKGHFDTKLSKTNSVKYHTFRHTIQQNKIFFLFSLKKKLTVIKSIPYRKGFHQRWKCLNNATNIKHRTEVHDIIIIETVQYLN